MSDNRKEAEEKMAKAIFISADCCFQCSICFRYVNLAMELPFRFRPIFAAFPINLAIYTDSDRILDLILRNIWPMLARNICGLQLSVRVFHRLRQFFPSILNDCRSLRVVNFHVSNLFTEFPADDSPMASEGQALGKWLFTPRPDNVPKAFANASSPANFIVVILSMSSFDGDDSVVPFDLTNELTREQLTLKRMDDDFLLIRCPIVRDTDKWEKEAIGLDFFNQWNQIDVHIYHEDEIGDGLLDTTPGPSDQQKK
ncbi:hypothetical protein niasHT_017728 [Heterodera trifolii]|uniref:Uncharacterized protein n=1 Tax=Heterodera trifolii TaxID=157864 RepID=A0ABD2L6T4_9BILA